MYYTELQWHSKVDLLVDGPLHGKQEKQKCAYILLYIGDHGREVFNTFTFTANDTDKVKPMLDKFEDYCKPKKNTIIARLRFNSWVQKPSD